MIQILPCAGCERNLVLPMGVSLEASIECPHCNEQFVVGEMLVSRLGTWTVIDDPSSHPPLPNSRDANPALASEVELTLAPVDASPSRPKPDWSNFKPITHDQYERMKRKSRSPIWSMLQVVFGGVAAVPIALLLLWHVLDRYVLDAGPTISRYVPWIVPEKFRDPELPPAEQVRDHATEQSRSVPDSEFRNVDDVLPKAAQASQDQPSAPLRPAFSAAEQVDQDSPGTASADRAELDGPPAGTAADASVEGTVAPSDMPEGHNIFSLIAKCDADLNAWREAVRAEKDLKGLAQVLYADLTNLAVVIDPLPESNPVVREVRDRMQPIGRIVKRQADVQEAIKQGSRFWVTKNVNQAEYPLAVVVEIAVVMEEDGVWRLNASEPTKIDGLDAEMIVPGYLAPTLIPGQRLLLLGMVNRTTDADGTAPIGRAFRACYLHAL